ncbi:deoxyribonuclease IV [Streptomyces aidingensis]|uniref:Probable endonuclease 4 n=1 Tax=Streptomyces aidingensis TaxID=910347 RepID=A0A1I1LTT6_9ACTN|nr:deoxyribonuclease IV [Streptomyces aidingensis]SFC72880.1 deoxyribonuclease-4 [Streptomyces aidingensis]
MPPPPSRSPIGAHVPVAGGLARTGLAYARRIGAEAVQVFVANPRGWATPAGNPAQDEQFRAGCAAEGLPVYVHAPYLINFGSHNPATAELSVASLRHSLRRGRAIGARGVVVHTGSATGGRERATALARMREKLLPLLDGLTEDDDPWLLLEPTAGQGASLCSAMDGLGPYLAALDHHPRAGICLDTCHAFAAGHDLAAPDGVAALLDELTAAAGPGRLRLIHANDSKDVCGARKDRHANIGAGHIGAAAFGALLRHPAAAGVPLVTETPGGPEGHAGDVARLKELRDAPGPDLAGAGTEGRAAHSSGPSPGSS